MKIGWDISHLEFTITDYYYYGKLSHFLKECGFIVSEVKDFESLGHYDTIVFNYPEKAFSDLEVHQIESWVSKGKIVVFAGYYKNEDGVGEIINSVTKHFGLTMNLNETLDHSSEDPYFVNVVSRNGLKGVFPCTDTVSGSEVILTSSVGHVGSQVRVGTGKIILLGTCVFWDSFSLHLADNATIAKRILAGEEV
ncbi:MAG TPA: hypothetical protein GX508_02075 [Coprothermobacter sp.]|nr:hypothetical protein [Coprothermobacter sp.]